MIMGANTFSTLRRFALLLGASAFAACYQYVPSELGRPAPGATVRTEVQGNPTFEVGDRIVRDVTRVDGEVIRWEPDTLALSALELRSFDRDYPGGGYTVRLGMADVVSVSLKRFDGRRTALLALAGAAVAFVAQQSLGGAARGSDNPPGGGTVH
jgi:hypothetical protein